MNSRKSTSFFIGYAYLSCITNCGIDLLFFRSAGGGGKGQGRKDKIMEKNKKLDENRAKRIEKEKTAKEENQSGNSSARMDIHPSRLARLPGLGN